MSGKEVNVIASVLARLRNHSKSNGAPFQQVLQQYAMERFLPTVGSNPTLSATSFRCESVSCLGMDFSNQRFGVLNPERIGGGTNDSLTCPNTI